MLVLSRKPGETIRVGDSIEIIVLATTGNRVRIGVVAPRNVNIVRKELLGRKRRNIASPPVVPKEEVFEVELNAHAV
ncbi:MAG: carbon storage regulator [Pirellulales bacterium]|nr:carbon storage regulator [Pirellulales bacterium]